MSKQATKSVRRARTAQPVEPLPNYANARQLALQAVKRSMIEQSPKEIKTIPVQIQVKRDANQGLIELFIKPEALALTEDAQFVWYCFEGRLEIRLSRKTSPLVGDSYDAPLGGFSFSGPPLPKRPKQESYRFTALVTTPDGYFAAKEFQFKISG
jgi:hypothetical protein